MIELLPGFWLASHPTLTHPWDASAYFIPGEEPTLIDCGSALGYPALKRALAHQGYQPRAIRRVIATHGHWDHVSGMAALRAESDAQLYIHAADRPQVETGDDDLTSAFLYAEPFPPLAVDGTLEDGALLDINGFRVAIHHTPGHSPGSVCLLMERDGTALLVAGDTLWAGFHPRVRSNIEDWQRSLDKLIGLRFDVLTTGHGPPHLTDHAPEVVREARLQLGVYYHPWFKPFYETFQYS